MSQPAANGPFQAIEYWLRTKMLRNNAFSRQALHNVLLRMKDRQDEVHHLMAAINGKDASSLCASAKSKDGQKRISVTILGKPYRMFAGELTYKIFRNIVATKKKLSRSYDGSEEDEVCVNPYHYESDSVYTTIFISIILTLDLNVELKKELEKLKITLNENQATIAKLEKQLKKSNQPPERRQQLPRNARKK